MGPNDAHKCLNYFICFWNKESILWDTYVKDAMWSFNKDFFFRTFLWCFLKPNLKRKKLMFWGDSGWVFLWAFVDFPVGPLMELISLAVQFFSYCIFKSLLYGALWASSTTRWIKLIISKVLDQFLILVDFVLLLHYTVVVVPF